MANQLNMADVQAILALVARGWSYRRIGRELGIDRATVGRYARGAGGDGSSPSEALGGCEGQNGTSGGSNAAIALTGSLSSPSGSGEGANPAMALTGVSEPAGSRMHLSAAWPWREVILAKLEAGLCAQRIYQDLRDPGQGYGYGGSYHSVRRLVGKLLARHDPPLRRMECAPGEEAQVDFGKGAPIVRPDGKRHTSWVFRIVLSHSRKGYSEAVARQGTDEFLRCLENAFAHFGGVPGTLVIDNLRAAVKHADWYDPQLCPKVRSFAQHYGIAILPTKPYTPRHKGKVENGVKYVKNNALKGRRFASLAEENQHLNEWESAVADTRIHGTTRQQVIKLFTEVEKPALAPLPAGRFEIFSEALRTVHRDGHVQVKGAYYSLPPEYLGQQVWARWDGRLVRLFDEKMRPIAVHAQRPPGRFSTQGAHIVPEKISGVERGTTWLLGQVARIGPQSLVWAQSMLAARGIEGVRVLMGLLNLSHRHPQPQVERACAVAASHGAWHLRSLRQLIQRDQAATVQQTFEFAREHPIIRPVADYGQFVREALSLTPQESVL